MGVTTITQIENRAREAVVLFSIEKPQSQGSGAAVPSGGSLAIRIEVPWAADRGSFPTKHLRLEVGGVPRHWIWQAHNADGDHVRFSSDGLWHDRGEPVDGISLPDGERTLVVLPEGFQVVHLPRELLDLLHSLDEDHFRLTGGRELGAVPSVPKSSAVAFSVAGPASDRRTCVYRDSGKRYEFQVQDGSVVAKQPDGLTVRLTQAISFTRKREGEHHAAPPFDLIAASGGRVLAKERGASRFYFATLDEMFVHCLPDGARVVPSIYFKLDPESNHPGARAADLTKHLDGWFRNHPAAERFPLFRAALAEEAMDAMIVRVQPGTWHLIDPRPSTAPSLELAAAVALTRLLERVLSTPLGPLFRESKAELEERILRAREADDSPPAGVPTYPHVVYTAASGGSFTVPSIAFRRVLDIGVGHVHHHEQYEGITGGELQPVRNIVRFLRLYQFFNGPVWDGDGYIDGTCNFYALVELGEPDGPQSGYALLYQDEQSYFSRRWRLVGPDDGGKLLFSLAADLERDLYRFDPTRYWSPFASSKIGPKSRLAVAAQVVLITGDAQAASNRIYSTNFSWSTMDRTWRWRSLPLGSEVRYLDGAAEAAGTEPIAEAAGDTIYPQTIRLREDMTLHVKGTRSRAGAAAADVGRWYQRYLPASNELVPPANEVQPRATPSRGYTHSWKFLPEAAFQLADRFSHFGVYASVDSRSQYYVLEPATRADADALAAAEGARWVDREYRLYRWAPKFSWAAPLHMFEPSNLIPGVLDRRPPSLYNRETQLRVVRRGTRWIATHWDKRDDDLLPFGGPFDVIFGFKQQEVTLVSGGRQAKVTLRSHVRVDGPPAVERVEFRWSGARGDPASILIFPAVNRPLLGDVWRLRLAALVPGRPGAAINLVDVVAETGIRPLPGTSAFEVRWTPSDADLDGLRQYCTADGAAAFATSIWFEDVVGHVSTPEQVRWLRTNPLELVIDETLRVPEASRGINTGIDLRPGDEYALDGGGRIKSGVFGTGWNGPEGWNNVDHDPKFPLHDGPDAHPFALIARFEERPYFYVGRALDRRAFVDPVIRRLHLRTNDDTPGNGEGEFSCRVLVWRARSSADAVAIVGVVPNPSGADVQPQSGEHVTLRNVGSAPVPVGGWYLEDAVGHRLTIPAGYEIEPQRNLRVYTGPGTSTRERMYCDRRAAVLNNKGDTVVLHDGDGTALSTYRY